MKRSRPVDKRPEAEPNHAARDKRSTRRRLRKADPEAVANEPGSVAAPAVPDDLVERLGANADETTRDLLAAAEARASSIRARAEVEVAEALAASAKMRSEASSLSATARKLPVGRSCP